MEQIKLGDYTRQEMAEILNLDVKDTRHFKRNLENKLDKWGYNFIYTTKKITIFEAPTAPLEKLKEIMVRVYDLDIQIDAFGFACFMYYLAYCEEFQTMPWEERVKMLEKDFKVSVDSKTLRRWADKLFKKDMLMKDRFNKTVWITMYIDGKKVREMVDGNEPLERDYKRYIENRREFFKQNYSRLRDEDKDEKEASAQAWSETFTQLWGTYHCCYYSCSSLWLNAIGDEAQEIFELVDQIVEGK